MRKLSIHFFFMDLAWFLFCLWSLILPGAKTMASDWSYGLIGGLTIIAGWLFFSLLVRKYDTVFGTFLPGVGKILATNLMTLTVVVCVLYFVGWLENILPPILKGLGGLTFGEGVLLFVFLNLNSWISKENEDPERQEVKVYLQEKGPKYRFQSKEETKIQSADSLKQMKEIQQELGSCAMDFVTGYFDSSCQHHVALKISKNNLIHGWNGRDYETIMTMNRVNDLRWINKHFEAVNSRLYPGGIYICYVRPQKFEEEQLLKSWPPVINYLVFVWHFLFRRVFPKLRVTKALYFFLTKGRNRSISKLETLGRLYSCGFKLVEEKSIDGVVFFVVKKVREPAFDMNPSYGAIFKMRRIGKGGKEIRVYKLRTMYPYSEYLQEYFYEKNGMTESTKIRDDNRVTPLGRFLRKYWLDELPMVLNMLKGEVKLVGVRPLSHHKLSMYDPELQELRKKVRPGLMPPFYADLPKNLEGIQASERRYMESYLKRPFRTDLYYFFAIVKNIVFKKARGH